MELLTDKQTDRQTDKRRAKHNFRGRGISVEFEECVRHASYLARLRTQIDRII